MMQSQTLSKDNKFFQFMVFNYTGATLGLVLVSLLSFTFYKFNIFQFGDNVFLTILITKIFILLVYLYLEIKLRDINYVINQQTSWLVTLLTLKLVILSLMLSPIFILLQGHIDILLNTLVTTVITFVTLSVYVYKSKNDLSFSSSKEAFSNFRILFKLLFFILIMSNLCMLIMSFMGLVVFGSVIHIFGSFIGLIFAIVMNIYLNGVIKKLYFEFKDNNTALARLGIMGISILISNFIDLFIRILEIYLIFEKNKKRK